MHMEFNKTMKLRKQDLWTLEEYSTEREDFRRSILKHKKDRQLFLGPNATLYFEDALTMKYQIQEMLRIEKIFESSEIEEEIAAYNPLIPDGDNWKATFMIEYPDPIERAEKLAKLVGIEDKVWLRVGGEEKVYAITNEDLDRSREEKTAAVHFMRFQLETASVERLKNGGRLDAGIDHPEMQIETSVPIKVLNSLLGDLS